MTRRFQEQRWLLDNIIRSVGVDWDQPRTLSYNAPCGPEANADFAAIRAKVQKFADISPAFQAAAHRREIKAREADDAGETITARQNYFMAAVHYAAAQWSFDENNKQNLALNARKRQCYARYSQLTDHRVEAAWVQFQGKALPGWLHFPPGYSGGQLPVVWVMPGMDSFKEANVAMHGDRWLTRGIAVLALEGPGQYESAVLGIHASVPNWIAAAHAVADWLTARPEIDSGRMGIAGQSFGSFFGTIVAANEPRFSACAVTATCLEPGCHTIFEEASPTFKQRFMYMAGYTDEDAFDQFAKTLTWHGHAEKIRMPFHCIAGEADELCPLEHTEAMLNEITAPKRLVIYQDSRHSVGNVPSTNLGPTPAVLTADWMQARLAGKPFESERWFVEANGRVGKTGYPST
ncbi:MAG: dipeptidyl aminopeptidase [Betaproteobacteria bacterium]|nr:dipeptidyl aminopeptidase [Betaproteobacteria bacterium]